MSATIPSLWPEDLAEEVMTPLALLLAQANQLGPLTGGYVIGEVTTVEQDSPNPQYEHRLDLYAPVLDFRRRILVATHARDGAYPVTVQAESLPRTVLPAGPATERWWGLNTAATFGDLVELVRQVLTSTPVKAAVQSLSARSREAAGAKYAKEYARADKQPEPADSSNGPVP